MMKMIGKESLVERLQYASMLVDAVNFINEYGCIDTSNPVSRHYGITETDEYILLSMSSCCRETQQEILYAILPAGMKTADQRRMAYKLIKKEKN